MTSEPIIEEPDDIESNPGPVANASSNGIALSGNNTAQALAALNARGQNNLAASIAALPAPKERAHVSASGFSFMDLIPVVNIINRGVEAGVNCHHNNKNRESYNQESIRYHQTVRELAQREVDSVVEQCNTIRETHSKQCDTAVEIDKKRCKTWLEAKEKEAKNRELEIKKNSHVELMRDQQNASTANRQIRADVQMDKERLKTELNQHYITKCAEVEKCRMEQSTELAKVKAKVDETKSKNELELEKYKADKASEECKMKEEGKKYKRECATGLEQKRIESRERLATLKLLLGMNSNRRDSANDPGTSSSSSTSSPQNESTSPPAFQSILIICYYNRNSSALHCRPFKISAENRLCGVANYLLTSDESQSLPNVQIENACKLLKIPDNMNAQEFSSILCALEGPPLDDFEGVSELNTIDIPVRNGYCHQIKVHFG